MALSYETIFPLILLQIIQKNIALLVNNTFYQKTNRIITRQCGLYYYFLFTKRMALLITVGTTDA